MTDLNKFFKDYMEQESIFVDKNMFQSNYIPLEIPHREEQIKQIAEILAPVLRNEKPSNIFIYGKTGTGKTLTTKHTTNKLLEVAEENKISLKVIYVNCKLKKVADTEYRMLAQIIKELGEEVPSTGLPTHEVYKVFFNLIEKSNIRNLIIILDEVDQLVKKAGDETLYNLTRINENLKNTYVTIIGISNDLIFVDNLDPRVKSSLSEEEILFPPYNAFQIQDILYKRAEKALKKDSLEPGVIEKCSAYAAREHGDARRALDLLRVAAEIAERSRSEKIRIEHIDKAEEKIERDRIIDIVKTLPKQHQAALYSIITIYNNKKKTIFTGEVYDFYREVCKSTGLRPLTQRRIGDIISELDMQGIINAKVISKGRYGRTKEITIAISDSLLEKISDKLKEELQL